MSLLHAMTRYLAQGVARRAREYELFEKHGERAVTEVLPEDAWNPTAVRDGVHTAAVDSRVRLVGKGAVSDAIRPRNRPMIVHHWATWCAPCTEELPRIQSLAEAVGEDADLVGVSWELFEFSEGEAKAEANVLGVIRAEGLSWDSVIFTGRPEELFEELELESHQVPQTRVLAADGSCLLEVEGPLSEEDMERVKEAVRS